MRFAPGGAIFRTLRLASAFRGDHERSARDELIDDLYSGIEQAAGIRAEVENESFHSLFLQLLERVFEVIGRRFTELSEANVANFAFGQREFALAIDILDRVHL